MTIVPSILSGKMEGKRILGIDPGSGKLGLGLIEIINGKPHLMHYDCIITTPNSPEPQKLSYIYDEFVNRLNKIKPDLMAIETLFFTRNITSAFSVGQASLVAPVSSIYQAITVVLALIFLKETMTKFQFSGILSIILGILLLAL